MPHKACTRLRAENEEAHKARTRLFPNKSLVHTLVHHKAPCTRPGPCGAQGLRTRPAQGHPWSGPGISFVGDRGPPMSLICRKAQLKNNRFIYLPWVRDPPMPRAQGPRTRPAHKAPAQGPHKAFAQGPAQGCTRPLRTRPSLAEQGIIFC